MAIFWDDGTSLYHYGITGMKRGIRRYQNPDGTFTEEGKLRYGRVAKGRRNNEKRLTPDLKRALGVAATSAALLAIGSVAVSSYKKQNDFKQLYTEYYRSWLDLSKTTGVTPLAGTKEAEKRYEYLGEQIEKLDPSGKMRNRLNRRNF